jgi:hypothetical protein
MILSEYLSCSSGYPARRYQPDVPVPAMEKVSGMHERDLTAMVMSGTWKKDDDGSC